jgi:hypothetical protein
MTHEFDTLPDVLGALEDELRVRAAGGAVAAAPSRRAVWRRPAVGVACAAACAVVLVLLPGSTSREASTAYGEIPLLVSRPEPVPPHLRQSPTLKEAGGAEATATRAWAFDLRGGTGYLLQGPGVWCLSVPGSASEPPSEQLAMACVADLRYGLAVTLGSTYVAAVPEGAPGPVIHHTDGTTTKLKPNADGIVLSDALEPGSTVTRYGTDGTSVESSATAAR